MREERPDAETESNSSSTAKIKRKRRSQSSSEREADATTEPVSEGEILSSRSLSSRSSRSKKGRSSRRSDDGGSSSLAASSDHRAMDNSDRRDSYANGGREDSSSLRRSMLEQLQAEEEEASSVNNGRGKTDWMRKSRLLAGKVVEDARVQLFIIFLIIVNAIIMGIGTFDFVTDDPRVDTAFEKTDRAFLIIFTVELLLQLHYRRFTFFSDSWLIFDFAIVVLSWSLESLQVVRAFRIFRAFRLVTRIGTLRELVMAIGAVMPRMYAIAMLLFLIFYIFAVLFTELFSELELSDNYFGSLDQALFTCMEMMTLEWSDVTREIMKIHSWGWAPLVGFVSVTGFIVFNLIVAVVCDAVAIVDREAQAEKHPELLTDKQSLEEAQERIWELTETVEILMMRQERLASVADMLVKEVRAAVVSPNAAAAFANPAPALKSAMKSTSSVGRNHNNDGNYNNGGNPPRNILQFSKNEGRAEEQPIGHDEEEIKNETRPDNHVNTQAMAKPIDEGNDTKVEMPSRSIKDTARVSNGEGVKAQPLPNRDDSVEVKARPNGDSDTDLKKMDNSSNELERDVQSAVERITVGRTDRSAAPPGPKDRTPGPKDGSTRRFKSNLPNHLQQDIQNAMERLHDHSDSSSEIVRIRAGNNRIKKI